MEFTNENSDIIKQLKQDITNLKKKNELYLEQIAELTDEIMRLNREYDIDEGF